MDFKDLSYIVAIAKHQSITKASNELYVTQPTLSKFLQNLEKHLGQKLFKKVGNKFILTHAGEKYISGATEILHLKKALDSEMADIIKYDKGEISVGFPYTRATYSIHKTLPVFKRLFPNVKVNIVEATSSELEDKILSGEIDIAFFNSPVISSNINYDIISREEILLVASALNPLAEHSKYIEDSAYPHIDLHSLSDELFILQTKGQRTFLIIQNEFKKRDFTPQNQILIGSIHASIELAALNHGVTFSCETHLKHFKIENEYQLFSFGNPSVFVDFVVAYRKGSYLSRHTQEFIKVHKQSILN